MRGRDFYGSLRHEHLSRKMKPIWLHPILTGSALEVIFVLLYFLFTVRILYNLALLQNPNAKSSRPKGESAKCMDELLNHE